MWQDLCRTRSEYLESKQYEEEGYSNEHIENLLYETSRLEGISVKKQDFLKILNGEDVDNINPAEICRINDLKDAFEYVQDCARQHKYLSVNFIKKISSLVMKSTGKIVNTPDGSYDTSSGDFRLNDDYPEEGVIAEHNEIRSMLSQLCKDTNEKLFHVHDIMIVKLAADLNFRFVHIKPFGAGNLSTGVLLMNYIQMLFEEPLIVIKGEDKAKYLSALKAQCIIKAPENFELFIANQLLKSLRKELSHA